MADVADVGICGEKKKKEKRDRGNTDLQDQQV